MGNFIGPIIIIIFILAFVILFIFATKYGTVSTRRNHPHRRYKGRNSVRIGRLTISSKSSNHRNQSENRR